MSASVLMRKHGDYGDSTLAARSMLASLAPLFKGDEVDGKISRLQQRLSSSERRAPEHISGRQMFLKDLNARASAMKMAGRSVAPGIHVKLMQKHGRMWSACKQEVRDAYHAKAEEEQRKVREELTEKKRALCGEMAVLRARQRQAHGEAEPLRVSSCRFSAAQIAEFNALYESDDWTAQKVEQLRQATERLLEPPPPAARAILDGMDINSGVAPHPSPAWLACVCVH